MVVPKFVERVVVRKKGNQQANVAGNKYCAESLRITQDPQKQRARQESGRNEQKQQIIIKKRI